MFLYGKHFSRMYQGSMVGAGFGPYAVMGYVVSNQQPNSDGRFTVDLNPVLLAATFGESQDKIEKAIEYLCSPDPKTTTPGQEGRRLVKEGNFLYWVVNGAMYAKIRNEEERREQNRIAQQNHRAKKKGQVKSGPESQAFRTAQALEAQGKPADAARVLELDEKLREAGRVSSSGASNEAGKMDTVAKPKTASPSAPPPSGVHSTPPTPRPSVPAPNPSSHPIPPAARPAASVVPAVMKQLRRVQSVPNPVFGGWQQKEIGTGTAAPGPLPAAGNPAPAAAHSPSSDEPSEEEPPTE